MVELLKSMSHSLARLVHHPSDPEGRGSVLDPSMSDELRQALRERRVPAVHLDEKYLLKPR